MTSSNFNPFIKSTNVRDINMKLILMNIVFSLTHIFSPKRTRNFVKKRFFTPISKPPTSKQAKWHIEGEQINIPFNKIKLKAWKIGSGPAILFVHGWNGRGIQFHNFFKDFIDAGFSVIFYDAPAHGASDGEMTNYYEMTACLDAIFKYNFEDEIVGVVGHSMGASVIINYLHDQPKDIPLVFVAPALPLLEILFQSFQTHGIPKDIYCRLMWELEKHYQIPLENRNPIDLIAKVNNDVLIVHDENDKITPITASVSVSESMRNVQLIMTEGLGHNRLLDNSKVIKASLDFINSKAKTFTDPLVRLIQEP